LRPRPSRPSAGHNIYTRLDGITRLRNAIAAKQQRDYGLDYDPETEVLVASGATGGLHAAAMALLNPGDEVLLFEPFYGYHVSTLKSMRVNPVLVPLAEPDWALDTDALRRHHPEDPRHHPQHALQSQRQSLLAAELEAIAEVCQAHDLFLFHR
jgi:aminotransferase